jgi:hypothetical protein
MNGLTFIHGLIAPRRRRAPTPAKKRCPYYRNRGPPRSPLVIRWPGHIKPGKVKNQLLAALDWVPTFVNIADGPKGDELKSRSRPASIRAS